MTQSGVALLLFGALLLYSNSIVLKVNGAECYDNCLIPTGPEFCWASEMWEFRQKVF